MKPRLYLWLGPFGISFRPPQWHVSFGCLMLFLALAVLGGFLAFLKAV